MVKNKNSTLSAVSLLETEDGSNFYLKTVHNPWATNKLSFDIFDAPNDIQYYADLNSNTIEVFDPDKSHGEFT